MTKNKTNLKNTEKFVRQILLKNFKQKLDKETLREAAEKLCEALPEKRTSKKPVAA